MSEALTAGQVAAQVRRIHARGPVLIGIDGPGGSGKSTLAEALAALLGLEVVHGDDFYKVSKDRAPTGTADGASFDLGRLADQVVRPAARRQLINYQKYDWDKDVLGDWVKADATHGLIVEGIYTSDARLRAHYDVRIYVMAPRETRLARGIARDGEAARKLWVDQWMPAEDKYESSQRPQASADLVLVGESDGAELTFRRA